MWRNPIPWKNTALTPNLVGGLDSTDDMRPGLGYGGVENLQRFVKNGGVLVGSIASAQFAIDYGMTNGVSMTSPNTRVVTGTYLKTRLVDDASPIMYGVADGIAAYSGQRRVVRCLVGAGWTWGRSWRRGWQQP